MKFSPLTLALAAGAAYLISRPSKTSVKSTPSLPIKLTETSIEVLNPDKVDYFYTETTREYLNSINNDLTRVNYIPVVHA